MSSNPDTTENGEQTTPTTGTAPASEATTQNETPAASTPTTPADAPASAVETPASTSAETPSDAGSETPPADAPAPAPAPAVTPPAPAAATPPAAVIPNPNTPTTPAAAAAAVSATADADAAAARRLTTAEAMLKQALDGYAEALAPGKPVKADVGAQVQLGLYRTLMHLLNRPGTEFTPLWTLLLAFAHDQTATGVFGPRYLFRFFPQLRMPAGDIRNFERILHLVSTTADPSTRALAIKQVDLNVVLQGMSHPTIVQNLRSYYGA